MNRFSFVFFLISGILCFGSPAAAQPQAIRFEHITVADGLSNANITASVQDPQGFMWFATHDGLNRYDGYGFTHYRHHPGDSTSLANNYMHDLLIDRLGRLWIATNLGLDRFDPVSEGFVHHRHDPEDLNSLSHDLVNVLMEDQSGTLWVGTKNGLNRLDPTTGSLTRFLQAPNNPSNDNNITALLEDADGMIWVGTDGGLNRLDPETGTFKLFRHTEGDTHSLIDNRIRSVVQDQAGTLWVGTCQGGLHQYDAQADTFDRLLPGVGSPIYAPWTDQSIYGVCAGGVGIIHEDQSGVLWLGSFNAGFNRYNPATGKLTKHAHEPANPTSLSDNAIVSLYEDPQGRLWIGTLHGGLNKVDPSGSKFQYHTRDALSPNSLSDKTVESFIEDRSGMLWIGTLRGGLNQLDRSTGNFTHYKHDPGVPGSLSDNWILDIYEDRAGVLWVGTWFGGLNRFDPSTRTFTHFRHDPGDPNTLSDDTILNIQEDDAGALWVATWSGGLNRFDPSTQAFTRFQYDADNPASLSNNNVLFLYVDGAGTLWIGTGDGLNRFDPETESFTAYLAGRTVTIIGEDAGGTLWVGTQTDGVHRFNPISGTSQRFTVEEGLPSNAIACLVGDESGDLWISTLSKLARFDHQTESFRSYDIGGGLEHNGYVWESCYRSRQGELFFGGYEGYISFFPEDIQDNPYPPQVALTALRVFDQTVPTGASEREIRLNHNQNDLSFDYVGLDYTASEQIRYRYQLQGYDDGWVDAGIQRTARYPKLPPGDFVFHVTAANSDGVWNEEGVSVQIVIKPPWWQTWWAYTIYGLLFLAGVFVVDRVQRRRLIRKERERAMQRELEQKRKVEKAHAELQEAHTHLKTTQAQLIQAEKMASLGQLTAGIAHEIKNPLNFVNNFAQLSTELTDEIAEELDAHADKTVAEIREDLDEMLADLKLNTEKIEEHGRRAAGIVQAMMDHARGGEGERRAVGVNALLEEYVNLAFHGKRANVPDFNVTIERDYDEAVGEVEMAPQDIGRVFINLLNNAFDAVHERALSQNGQYAPTVTVSTRQGQGQVEIRVADNGSGIAEAIQEKIFEPFFTTKPTGQGTGLGLSLSYEIVTQGHGGTLTVESAEGEGATFVITLPA